MSMSIISNDIIKTASLTASTTASGYSVNNLKNDKKSSVWRSTTITSQVITAIFSNASCSAVGIAFANLIANSTIRVKFFTDTGGVTQVADSGVITVSAVHPPPAGFTSNNSLSFAYGGGNHFFVDLGAAYTIRRIDVTLNNPGGGTDAYIDVCRIVAGVADSVRGMLYGAAIKMDDETKLSMTESGDVIVNRLPSRKIIDATVALLNTEIPAMMGIIRKVGAHTPVFVAGAESYTDDPSRSDFRCYGYIDASGLDLRKIAPFYDNNNFVIKSI